MSKQITIFRSPMTSCWDGDLDSGVEKIDDVELAKIAQYGYNGIWLHQPLRDYTPSNIFPEFGRESDRYLHLLDKLAKRAACHDIRIYMYLLEPRAILADDPFWGIYPELRGQHFLQPGYDLNYYALCSSQPRVREYLYDSLQKLCSRIDMSFFSITAAEDFTTCIGKLVDKEHAKKIHCCEPHGIMVDNDCPLCSKRTGPEIISELLNTMHDGISAGNPNADLIAWDWGWRKLPWQDTGKNILDSLNKDIIYISDFEIGGEREFPQKQGIYEYSLGYVGPSESFTKLTTYAREHGRRVGAKLQVGTTHEIASVPNLPLIHNLWKKVNRAQKLGISVAFATWNLGTYQTMNTYLFGHALKSPETVSWNEFLQMACDYLNVPLEAAPNLEKAWNYFERALEYLPFSVPMLYQGPINYASAYWLPPRQTQGTPMGMSCHILKRGDNLDFCCGNYALDEVIELYGKLVNVWGEGLKYIEQVKSSLLNPTERFMQEYYNAKCIYHVYQSTLNVFKAYVLCRSWRDFMLPQYLKLCEDELNNCKKLLPLLEKDDRLGMHLECKGYMFDVNSVNRKIEILVKHLLSKSCLTLVM
jgi:hypothetical protein